MLFKLPLRERMALKSTFGPSVPSNERFYLPGSCSEFPFDFGDYVLVGRTQFGVSL